MTWAIRRIEHLASEVRVTIAPETLGDLEVDHYSIPALDATGAPAKQAASEIESTKQLLSGGEVLISRLNPRKARVLVVPPSVGRIALASGEFVVLRPNHVDPRFLEYLLRSEATRQTLGGAVHSVTRSHERIRPENVLKLKVSVPARIVQQRAIADFLDNETARIDALITKKRSLQAAVLERCWSQTLRAVTLGLSGVADTDRLSHWGPIRRSWPTPLIGAIARIYPGTSFPAEEQGSGTGDIPFVKVADLGRDKATDLVEISNWVTNATAKRLGARIAPPGSVLYARVGAALLLNPRRILREPAILDDNVRGIAFDRGDPRYWAYLLSFLDLGALANPGPVPSISEDQVAAVSIPCPPPEEQTQIAGYCDRAVAHGRIVANHLGRQLDLLDEHRQALITAAVTGELDIPGTAA